MTVTRRHLLSLSDLTDEELRLLVDRGAAFAEHGVTTPSLAGKVVGVFFRQTSTRTRTSFSVAALRLGAQLVTFGPHDLQENTGEDIGDTAAVLARMLDGLVVRSADSDDVLAAYAGQDRMAVVNAMGATEHPTQAVTDLVTLKRRFGRVDGIRVLYVGEGNNTAVALAQGLTRFPGAELHVVTPPGYGMPPEIERRAAGLAAAAGSVFTAHHDLAAANEHEFDVVYTTRWQTTGTGKADPHWRDVFAPYQVDEALMKSHPDATFMHDLPAHRGEEVVSSVLDGPSSIALDQAENKLHAAVAVLEWCVLGGSVR